MSIVDAIDPILCEPLRKTQYYEILLRKTQYYVSWVILNNQNLDLIKITW